MRSCDISSLSLALGLMVSWLSSCEEHVRRINDKHIEGDVTTFDVVKINTELSALPGRVLSANVTHATISSICLTISDY